MENETKYSLVIMGVALLALVAFNYNEFSGSVILRNSPTMYQQESLNLIRNVEIPDVVRKGNTVEITFMTDRGKDLIQTNKERIVFYDTKNSRMKKQLLYPACRDGRTSACFTAEDSYTIPMSWNEGSYKVQIEREKRMDDKVITEIIGRTYFKLI